MRIKQCKMLNEQNEKIFKYFFKKYSLEKYYDVNSPAIFFSMWNYGSLKKHKSLAVIIWRGTDIVKNESKLKSIKNMKNVYHIAISSYIKNDLKKYKIKSKFIPVVGKKMKYFQACPLGDEIYTYVPDRHIKYEKRYGLKIIKKVQAKCKYKINISRSNDEYTRKELVNVYKRCFCGLRFSSHDGLPNTVLEMCLTGRKSIYNGNIPGSIKWNKNNIDKIIENIEIEAQKIGTIDRAYADEISKFIDIGDKWLNTEYWEK